MTGRSPAASAAADEADRAVEAVVVGDGQSGQPERDGPLDQLVRAEAPSRNEKLVWQWSSAYGVGATRSSGGGRLTGARKYRTDVLC